MISLDEREMAEEEQDERLDEARWRQHTKNEGCSSVFGPLSGHKEVPEGPKMAPRGPKMAPRGPKKAPKRPQEGPRWGQDRPS